MKIAMIGLGKMGANMTRRLTVLALSALLEPGDTVIDGGNTYYKDDVRRAGILKNRGVHFTDVGTSGGTWGLESGYSLMIGGEKVPVQRLAEIFRSLAPGRGDIPATPHRQHTFGEKMLSAMRKQYGGHLEAGKGEI